MEILRNARAFLEKFFQSHEIVKIQKSEQRKALIQLKLKANSDIKTQVNLKV